MEIKENMTRFVLQRIEDESGVSGTGYIAEGVQFTDGTCALRWRTQYKSTAVYENMNDLKAIHGHNGKTKVLWNHNDYQAWSKDDNKYQTT